ncbi:MAG: hypothetical protein ACREHC_00915 [Candidatus Levyibacteriota bacterium]
MVCSHPILGTLFVPIQSAFRWIFFCLHNYLFAKKTKVSTNKVVPGLLIVAIVLLLEAIFLFYSWDFYLNHYPKRPIVAQSW